MAERLTGSVRGTLCIHWAIGKETFSSIKCNCILKVSLPLPQTNAHIKLSSRFSWMDGWKAIVCFACTHSSASNLGRLRPPGEQMKMYAWCETSLTVSKHLPQYFLKPIKHLANWKRDSTINAPNYKMQKSCIFYQVFMAYFPQGPFPKQTQKKKKIQLAHIWCSLKSCCIVLYIYICIYFYLCVFFSDRFFCDEWYDE